MGRSHTSYQPGQSGNPTTQFSSSNQPRHDRTLPRISYRQAMTGLQDNPNWAKMATDVKFRRIVHEQYGDNGLKAIAYIVVGKALQGDMRAAKIIQRTLDG